ncbi:MAG: peptidoglycan-associated lipoprotein Pal [Betaproteobacteria bacterium]|nr:peptidoglycan-associated lipoprotein Pal [Betaproteobacteria bacterium]
MKIKKAANLVAVSMVLVLAACASQQAKQAPTSEATPSPAQQQGAQTQGVTGQPVGENPLNNPNNILYKKSVYYAFDKYNIEPKYMPIVEAHAQYLKSHPQATVRLEGNCDERGSREYNLALGQRRADAVAKAMELLGVPSSQITTVSWGSEKPKALGHNEEAWAQNRRTDIVYTHE